jgi:hypothetical protein
MARNAADVADERFWLIFTRSGQAVDIARDSGHADDMREGGWRVVEVTPTEGDPVEFARMLLEAVVDADVEDMRQNVRGAIVALGGCA